MDIDKLKTAVENGNIEWHRHGFERMLQRGISRQTAKEVLLSGKIIEDYPEDKPFPSALFLGWVKGEPFHVVAAFDLSTCYCFVITAYKPDLAYFESDYKTRRKDE